METLSPVREVALRYGTNACFSSIAKAAWCKGVPGLLVLLRGWLCRLSVIAIPVRAILPDPGGDSRAPIYFRVKRVDPSGGAQTLVGRVWAAYGR
jgi:hypothetical protein